MSNINATVVFCWRYKHESCPGHKKLDGYRPIKDIWYQIYFIKVNFLKGLTIMLVGQKKINILTEKII